MNIFKGKSKTPHEVVKCLKESIPKLTGVVDKKQMEKAKEEVSKYLGVMKMILYGDKENEPNSEQVAQLAQEVYNNDILVMMVQHISHFEFEAKKDVTQIFNNLLRRQLGTRYPTVEYICTKECILHSLVEGIENPDVALHCGMMLRECVRQEALCKIIIHSKESLYRLFNDVEMSNFDVASDAFATFKDILTKHKDCIAEFLEENYDAFFQHYTHLLQSENYVTRRQSVKLLGELLLDRHHFNTMTRYISDAENLKIIMNLLRDKSKNIQYEAFHVFKVFVANPHKPKIIADILIKNQQKLLSYLTNFNIEKEDDQLNDERAYLLKQIADLRPLPSSSASSTTTASTTLTATTPSVHDSLSTSYASLPDE